MYQVKNPCEDHNPWNRCERWSKSLGYAKIPDLRSWSAESALKALQWKKREWITLPLEISMSTEIRDFYDSLIEQLTLKEGTKRSINTSLKIISYHFSINTIAELINLFKDDKSYNELVALPNVWNISLYCIILHLINIDPKKENFSNNVPSVIQPKNLAKLIKVFISQET